MQHQVVYCGCFHGSVAFGPSVGSESYSLTGHCSPAGICKSFEPRAFVPAHGPGVGRMYGKTCPACTQHLLSHDKSTCTAVRDKNLAV